jgi:CBS domain-containing protein
MSIAPAGMYRVPIDGGAQSGSRPSSGEELWMLVREVLRKAPVTAPPSCSLREAAGIMADHGVGALLIMDGDRLVGITTDRDIVVRGVAKGVGPDTSIDSVMTNPLVTIGGGSDVREAYELLRQHEVRRLPVVEEDQLAGMLTVDDLLIRSTAELGALVQPITGEVLL